jgi:hypothetical protein
VSRERRKFNTLRIDAKKELQQSITDTFKEVFETSPANPMVKASHCWSIVQEQLETILGTTICQQWFKTTCPMVITNNVLMLSTESNFAAQWLNTHYKELVDALLQLQDPKLSCFFIQKRN